MPIALGIDPGLTGGLAIVSSAGRVIDATDVPTFGEGPKRRVDVVAVIKFIQQNPPDFAVIERGQALPKQGASSGFNYGRAIGALEACVLGLEIPLEIIEPSAWKKAHGLIKTDKEASRQKAILLYPAAHRFFAKKGQHGVAEAVLLARYGLMLRR